MGMAKEICRGWLEPDKLILIEGWARQGLTDAQIAHNMGCAYSTFRTWRDKYQALSAVLKKGKEVVDLEVENALLKRALGYEYEEITRELVYDKVQNKNAMKVTKVVKKQVAGDTTAQIFWLKNRRPDLWRDKPVDQDMEKEEIENTGVVVIPASEAIEDIETEEAVDEIYE